MVEADQLVETLRSYRSCAVAFSAGVDSTVVAKAAQLALGDSAVAVTGVGPALAEGELEEAQRLASQIGIRHELADTDEIHSAGYIANAPDRCFHCKSELYSHVERIAKQLGMQTLANGANVDDQGDYRPGMQAAADFEVRSPLVECGFGKQLVRDLAAYWALPIWNKPAAPCLASRIAYGQQVTPERLRMIDLAEQHLRGLGIRELRVRYHEGDTARIEVPVEHLQALIEPETRQGVMAALKDLGFKAVTVDLAGFSSGSLNQVLDASTLTKWRR
ncbi:hypothetical protein KOR34_06280 [Posidoniimonas corsicana]|uniref:NAD/GMP synthase domain-containing protein n=1 Tax=Posidoniimonas corsicana TaxID=1938618 RepID=A0A5C5VAU7_9BACT|nr:ATP-dependent sacrificial sulfur transferase LarE [Posidoniimonas corsicana]TWT35734.1 hypothetical protein KOR34_06280 [Posidoniimonas corsicana]